ncbi:MAG: 5-(carboxyamino)imidazole ribonucleotide synthase [Actinomycetes bacterium]
MSVPVVGMVGGGQLARMTQQASIPLGIAFRVLAADEHDSAALVSGTVQVGDHRALEDLRAFAKGCDVLTFDHEHVPAEHLHRLVKDKTVVRPGPHALIHAQDKAVMRARLGRAGIPAPRWGAVSGPDDLRAFADEWGWPVVLKAVRGGYDGKGVWVVESARHAGELLPRLSGLSLFAEERVPFRRELAALVARSPSGQAAAYPAVETVQRDGICVEVLAPAPGLDADRAVDAQHVALAVAGELDVTGLLAVELFETDDGLLVNELAMRPHNSGHWTLDGARTSQFEQHLRAVLDLPLGSPQPTTPYAVMANVLGGDDPDVHGRFVHVMAHDPAVRVHLYGKAVRPGRKIGHVTVCGDDPDDLRARARHAAAYLAEGDA